MFVNPYYSYLNIFFVRNIQRKELDEAVVVKDPTQSNAQGSIPRGQKSQKRRGNDINFIKKKMMAIP